MWEINGLMKNLNTNNNNNKKEQWGSHSIQRKDIVLGQTQRTTVLSTTVILLIQFSSVSQSCPTLCDLMNRSTPGLPVHHRLTEFTQIHVHRVSDAIQPSHPPSSPSPLTPNSSQHQSLFQWVNSSYKVAKVLELQPQHQSFQWTPRIGFL